MSELAERLIALTRDLILIPSSHDRPRQRRQALEFILNHLQAVEQIRVLRFESGGCESLLALPVAIDVPEVLLCGHVDVVSHPSEDLYRSKVRDGRIVGPGAGDMKGALAIMLDLFRRLHTEHPGASVGLAITSDEEIGGQHGLRYLLEEQKLRCRLAIIPDGGSLNEITVAEKGILHIRVRVQGQSAHAARPWLVDNVLHRLIGRLNRLIDHFESLRGEESRGREHWYPTCTVSMLDTSNTSINLIPDHAEAAIDVRFPPPMTVAGMREVICEVLGVGNSLTLNVVIAAEPTELRPDPRFSEAIEAVTGQPVAEVQASGGSDARFLCRYGIPVVLSRPLVGNLHAVDEWIDIESMESYYAICHRYVDAVLASVNVGALD